MRKRRQWLIQVSQFFTSLSPDLNGSQTSSFLNQNHTALTNKDNKLFYWTSPFTLLLENCSKKIRLTRGSILRPPDNLLLVLDAVFFSFPVCCLAPDC